MSRAPAFFGRKIEARWCLRPRADP